MAPANAKDADGRPELLIKGVPVQSDIPGVKIEQALASKAGEAGAES